MEDFDQKKENLAYTIGIIKPKTSENIERTNEIVKRIEEEGFIIKDILKKRLTEEEITNVFYKQRHQPHFKDIKKYMLSGQSTVLLLCNEKEDPIEKWKRMIGNKDPLEAKKEDGLRGVYGETMVRNELHGSDDITDSNKERDTFRFRIPQKAPEFRYDNFKLDQDKIMKWLYPANQEHPCVNQRLDILAVYGPVVNAHSVDKCFCVPCSRVAKNYLNDLRETRLQEECTKLGLDATNPKSAKQALLPPIRLIDEEGQQILRESMCQSCQNHCDTMVHLPSGRQGLHLMTDAEVKLLGEEMNRNELLELLRIEKGKAADIMMNQIAVQGDKRVEHDRTTVQTLLATLETDYYGRYSFDALQNLVLEDRRVRMVKWVSMIVEKPVHRFSNPKLFDSTIEQVPMAILMVVQKE